jgi:site-specific recombinase XerD
LKRRNPSPHTVKNYLNRLKHFVVWVDRPIEEVTHKHVSAYTDHLLVKRLAPKTINTHLSSVHLFYDYLIHEEGLAITNPVKKGYHLRVPRPLPRFLKEEEVAKFFRAVKKRRDRAIFMLMLRCGLRVQEVADLTLDALDFKHRKLFVRMGKGNKDRVVYLSNDAVDALVAYLKTRRRPKMRKVFLVEKGRCKGKPLSVRGIQKRMEYYAQKARLSASCHQLRHTMATQLLNADADIVTIQDLLGHSWITTTQRYCKVCNLKVERDYFKAIDAVVRRTTGKSSGKP